MGYDVTQVVEAHLLPALREVAERVGSGPPRRGRMSIDVVIPTVAGREVPSVASSPRCPSRCTPIVVAESKTCGWGWQQGLPPPRADYVLLVATTWSASAAWSERCIEAADEDLLACPRVYTPRGDRVPGRRHGRGRAPAQPPPQRTDPCDFTTVPFISAEQAEAIGMLDIQYAATSGSATADGSWATRRCCATATIVHHQEQVGRGAGMSQNERDAMDMATMQRELEKVAQPA